jgi:hypothetical protein
MPPITAGPTELVVTLDLGVQWDSGAPEAVLISPDLGAPTVLAIEPQVDDPDQRPVVLRWEHCHASAMEPPNDEALDGHRLYDCGLKDVLWCGEVHDSSWITDLERRNRVHDQHDPAAYERLRHFILPLKECVVEIVAETVSVHRAAGSTLQAAVGILNKP